jgi:hypothetical protein
MTERRIKYTSYYNRDSKSTKETSRVIDLLQKKCKDTIKGYAFSIY